MDKKPLRQYQSPKGNKKNFKNFAFIALLILFGLIVFAATHQPQTLNDVPLTQVVDQANSGKLQKITIKGNEVEATKKGEDKPSERAYKEANVSIYEQGLNKDIKGLAVNPQPSSDTGSIWITLAGTVLPVVLIGGVLFFMLRSAQGQGNQAMSFGKSKARLYGNEKDKIVFKNIAGSNEAKEDLEEIVEFLKFPKKFEGVGAKSICSEIVRGEHEVSAWGDGCVRAKLVFGGRIQIVREPPMTEIGRR